MTQWWETQGYDRSAFVNAFKTPGKADQMIAAREVLGACQRAIQQGTIDQWKPPMGCHYDQKYVERAVERLDRRWESEWRSRGQAVYDGPPNFAANLTYAQKMALVQRLRVALGKEGPG